MELNCCPAPAARRKFWRLLPAVLLLLSRPALAVDPVYNKPYTGTPFNINATNFVMDGTFNITAPFLNGWQNSLYHYWSYTQNFTNNSRMVCNTGFYFNNQLSSGNYAAAVFYNKGTISNGLSAFSAELDGGILIWASNIYNPGSILIAQDGNGEFYGNNIDLSNGRISINSPFLSASNTVGFFGQSGAAGLNATNALNPTSTWNPGASLFTSSARSSGPYPYVLYLPNSTAYLEFRTNNAISNIIVRAVFLNNISSNTVAANVYFGNLGLGGAGNVEWVSSYVNPVNGANITNYLYLNNNYTAGASTNVGFTAGIPNNFTFYSSPVPLNGGVQAVTNTGFPFGFSYPNVSITNFYSYVDASLVSSTLATNETNPQDYQYWTNWLGRLEFTATNSLTLSKSHIQGMNYLRFISTNQYNNNGSSTIIAPFADAYLGSTNGSMTISNLISSRIPGWSGSVQAWSTDWTNGVPDANGYTYEYKVMLVQSTLNPFNPPLQQDIVLYSSNNVVISDQLNVLRKLSINCTNLLITTNGVGVNAASDQGELNLDNYSLTWAVAIPNLRVLTNNGAIRTLNEADYGSATLPYLEFVNSGIISNAEGAFIVAKDVQSSGNFNTGTGQFSVSAQTVALTNGVITAATTFSSTSTNLIISGDLINAGYSMTLVATNLLTDNGVTNGNIWVVGANNNGFSSADGLLLPILPTTANLLGTTVTNIAVNGTIVSDVWSGNDYGANPSGFTNNAALGQLILDAQGAAPDFTGIQFNGVAVNGTTNAIYVDCLQFVDYCTNLDAAHNVTNLFFNTNLVIYYAQALANNISIAEKINHKNGDHLRWVPTYNGYFSSTNLVYPPGVTNVVNAAVVASSTLDSDGDGTPNAFDPTPVFVPAQLNFAIGLTNLPPKMVKIQWQTIPLATNNIYYRTNLITGTWLPFSSFNNYYYGPNLAVTNAAHSNSFISPQPYVPNASLPDNSQVTNIWVLDALTNGPRYYRVLVQPNPY